MGAFGVSSVTAKRAMTLPTLSSASVNESSSLSPSGDAPGVSTPLFHLNSLLHGDLSDPATNIQCHTDDVTDVTVSDDDVPTTALPPTSEDPRHPDVAFAHALVNSCLRAPLPVSTNGGGIPQSKSLSLIHI